jgi:hypothetical protein
MYVIRKDNMNLTLPSLEKTSWNINLFIILLVLAAIASLIIYFTLKKSS